jgi:hypothetical protein
MRALLLFVMCVGATAPALAAQQTSSRLTGNAMGVSMDWFTEDGYGLWAMSYRFSTLRPGNVGADLGVSLFPQALPAGVLALAGDFGASYNLPVPGGSLLLKAGGSGLAVLGTGGALLAPGFHVGGTVLVNTGERSGLRIDVIRHYYLPNGGEVAPVWSVGLGFAVIPRLRS